MGYVEIHEYTRNAWKYAQYLPYLIILSYLRKS